MNPQEIKSASIEALADCNYKYGRDPAMVDPLSVEIMRKPDGSALIDHNGQVIPIRKILATKPLKRDILTRPGPGGKSIAYLSGEAVSRTLNEIFGFDGWCLEIKSTNQEGCVKDDKGRYSVAYTATVRVTHRKSGTFKEDCGAGDSVDRTLGTAVAHAMKSAVTDAMKRAARHFGDKLGNSLYEKGFGLARAPATLQKALENYEMDQKISKFGDDNKAVIKAECDNINSNSPTISSHTTATERTKVLPYSIPSNPVIVHQNLPSTAKISTPVLNSRKYSTGNIPESNNAQSPMPISHNYSSHHISSNMGADMTCTNNNEHISAPTGLCHSSHQNAANISTNSKFTNPQQGNLAQNTTPDLSRFNAGLAPQKVVVSNHSNQQSNPYNQSAKNQVNENMKGTTISHQYNKLTPQKQNECNKENTSNIQIVNLNSTSGLIEMPELPAKRPQTSKGEAPEAKKVSTASSRNPYGKNPSY